MKNFKLLSVLSLTILLGVSCSKEDLQSLEAENQVATANSVVEGANAKSNTSRIATQRNGAPSGAHYNLNIIGVKNPKTTDMTGNNGGRIFVPLFGRTKIMLIEGSDFSVLDANGTDGSASFQLPNPDPDGDGVSSYSIYARALGTPGGSATITTCADADLTDDGYYEVCSAESLTVTRTKGGAPKFINVSTELLTILVTSDIILPDGSTLKAGRYTIFDPALEDYFWKYDNDGLKLLQLRFYLQATDITP
ncbi:hypothetical protein ACNQGP_06595 [Flavobacterium sp. GT2N3]|uniref:hypothetical protein n=1 Tax=unclassified Flavobacterium TaxID=196869 RepID=UPI003AAEB76C